MGRRNPNGYGCVTKLSGKRSRPWVIKVTVYDEKGNGHQTVVDYAKTEADANIILAKYNNNPWNVDRNKVTLAELYSRWEEVKLPKLGKSSQVSLRAAYKHCSAYYGVKYRSIRSYHMQDTIDSCNRGYSTQGAIKNLWGHLDHFAYELDIIDKMYSLLTSSPPIPETTRTPFTAEQINALWALSGDPWVDTVLAYIYTGFRLTELLWMKTEQVNLKEWYFQGGVKTASGKGRIVPIHDRIKPFVKNWVSQGNTYLIAGSSGNKISTSQYYKYWSEVMQRIDADKTPHEARHTFETNLDNAKANRKCIDLLMGHKSKDTGNRVYNHKTIEQLRETINLLQ